MCMRYTITKPLAAFLLPLLPLFALAQAPMNPANPTINYRTWGARLQMPMSMSNQLAQLCRLPLPKEEVAYAARSPHAKYFTQVYVNPVGMSVWGKIVSQERGFYKDGEKVLYNAKLRKALDEKMAKSLKFSFLVGTVIVKEKLPDPKSKSPVLLTAMRKREKGYNPACFDWEFMVLDGEGREVKEQGKIASCQSCHTKETQTNGVFTVQHLFNLREWK
jgi:Cytochrome P460